MVYRIEKRELLSKWKFAAFAEGTLDDALEIANTFYAQDGVMEVRIAEGAAVSTVYMSKVQS